MKRELRDKIKIARVYGYELVRRKNHLIFKHPDGDVITTSSTPSDPRSMRNFRSRLKRSNKNTHGTL